MANARSERPAALGGSARLGSSTAPVREPQESSFGRSFQRLCKSGAVAFSPSFNQLFAFRADIHSVSDKLEIVVRLHFHRRQTGDDQSAETEKAVTGKDQEVLGTLAEKEQAV